MKNVKTKIAKENKQIVKLRKRNRMSVLGHRRHNKNNKRK